VELKELEGFETRRVQEKRLDEFMRCGQVLLVRSCRKCGGDREGSGTFEGTRTCKCRACAACAWVRARRTSELMERAFDQVHGGSDYRWQMVVVTIRYDPEDDDDLSVAALRSRALLAGRVAKRVWKERLKKPDAGMLRSIEVSKRGHVHLNLIYYGPGIEKDEFEDAARAVDCRVGFCDIQDLDCDPAPKKDRQKCLDPRGSKLAVKAAARYAAKGLESGRGGNDEDWLAGDRTARVVDPVLAARWEIAVYRLKLLQRYGKLRGLELDEHGREGECRHEDDEKVACRRCGAVGAWRTQSRKAETWIQACHDRGSPALEGSTWKPRARDGPDYFR
jgi:hypothetical protein